MKRLHKSITNTLSSDKDAPGFGTFKGVYVPSLLTILGVIMYLRMGWVVGNVGIFGTLVIVTLSSLITFLTALSMSAIATNMKVGIGGVYYMISRSLGIEFGAAVGVPLFFAKAFGVSFYLAGFTESLHSLYPSLPVTLTSIAGLVVLTYIAYISTALALKIQTFIFVVIGLSLLSFFLGTPPTDLSPIGEIPESKSFWSVFAVFFPAVTGITAGISMSGDLKDPIKSLPWGTITAVLTGYVIYLAIPIFLWFHIPEDVLLTDPMILQKVAKFGGLILLGIWGATLSSALGSLLSAPRTLQALALDGVVPKFLGKGYGEQKTPQVAILFSFVVALAGILLGGLNTIAPILSMFFLTSYGFLNLTAGFESFINNPSWRPKFSTHWGISFLGAFGCFAAMFMINPGASILAIFSICALFYYFTEKKQIRTHWSDMRYAMVMLLARQSIYYLGRHTQGAKSWRPHLLVLSGTPTKRWYLIKLAHDLTQGKGFLTISVILQEEYTQIQRIEQMQKSVQEYLTKKSISALVDVGTAENVIQGARALIKNYGIGPLFPNTIVLGEREHVREKDPHLVDYVELIQLIHASKRNLVIVREGDFNQLETVTVQKKRHIDVWWGGQKQNVFLMLTFAYLLQTSKDWKGSILTIKTIVENEHEQEKMALYLQNLLVDSRLEAEIQIVVKEGSSDVFETIWRHSQYSDLLFLGMRPPDAEETSQSYSAYYENLLNKTDFFPPTALVLVAENIQFTQIFD